MAPIWDADVELDKTVALGLIEGQFPEFAPVRLDVIGEGWDNLACLVNDDLVFRIPRRQMGAELIDTEARFLSQLARHLPVEIPVPLYVGRATDDYPYPFLGYRHIPGSTGCSRDLSSAALRRIAPQIGRFLASLHSVVLAPEEQKSAPGDLIRRTDLEYRARVLLERFEEMRSALPDVDPEHLRETVEKLARTPGWSGRPCWLHGDLYARHLLLDEDDALCGVIDWGDVHRGDPSVDLGIAWSYLPADARPSFREAYGPIDDDTWARARFRSLHYAMALIAYGRDVGDHPLVRVGRRALDHGLEEPG